MFNRKLIADLYSKISVQSLRIRMLEAEAYNYRDQILALSPPPGTFHFNRCKFLEKQLKTVQEENDKLRGYILSQTNKIMEKVCLTEKE